MFRLIKGVFGPSFCQSLGSLEPICCFGTLFSCQHDAVNVLLVQAFLKLFLLVGHIFNEKVSQATYKSYQRIFILGLNFEMTSCHSSADNSRHAKGLVHWYSGSSYGPDMAQGNTLWNKEDKALEALGYS